MTVLAPYAVQGAQPANAFVAVDWLAQELVGPLGTSLAVIAVAWFGFELLAGRATLRRGGLLVLGCFILFGAPQLAQSLIGLARSSSSESTALEPQQIMVPPPPTPVMPPPFDPYAGASVPNATR